MSLGPSISHNVRHLVDFSGRDSRRQFWPWTIMLFILTMIANMVAIFSMMADMMTRMFRFMQEHPNDLPGDAPFKPGQSALPAELMPDMTGVMMTTLVVNIVFNLLIAAAVWRRLHDRDRTGLWALAYLPFLIAGPLLSRRYMGRLYSLTPTPADQALSAAISLVSLLGWVVLILLIIQLASEGTRGPNRFGEDPVTAP